MKRLTIRRRLMRGVGFAVTMSLLSLVATIPLWLPSLMLAILEVLP